MQLIDTHAHPHMEDYSVPADEFVSSAREASVEQVVCVGTDTADSRRALDFARAHGYVASVGLHPHEASRYRDEFLDLQALLPDEAAVAVGECGLDYHYENSPGDDQVEALHAQINLSKKTDLPLIFHLRNAASRPSHGHTPGTAFGDFFDIFDQHQNISGVVHSFTADEETMWECVGRGLSIGVNGIVTFSQDPAHHAAVRAVPSEYLVLETDAPFLTPHPYRGNVNKSAHVRSVVEFVSRLRGESAEETARITTQNARALFRL